MKKIFLLTMFLILSAMPIFAVSVGSYKTETDYGLIDGFKWNFFNRDKNTPLVQIKSETKEEQERIEKEKNRPKEQQDDVQLYRFMLDDVVAF